MRLSIMLVLRFRLPLSNFKYSSFNPFIMTGKRIIPSAGTLLVVLFLTLVTSCNKSGDRSFQDEVYDKSPEDLVRHSEEFRKEIISVGENIYVASGYGLANSILIEGTDGLIIIDAMESMQKGEEVIREFRKISPEIAQKPVKAIIYTHNHTDHVFGAQAMAREDDPMVIAHELMPYYLDRIATVIRPIIEKRSYRMFGNLLEEEELINCGIGPRLSYLSEVIVDDVGLGPHRGYREGILWSAKADGFRATGSRSVPDG